MSVEQKLVTINDHHAEYYNFFRYGHETQRMLAEGWYIKHVHDDQQSRTAWILYEKKIEEMNAGDLEKLLAVVEAAKAEAKIARENPSGYHLTILEEALAALES